MLPFVIQKCAQSVDGFIDDASPRRLLLSSPADFATVDKIRASCDAIIVGANTIRSDNPRLVIRSRVLQNARLKKGLPKNPLKVTITSSGNLGKQLNFFKNDKPLIYCPTISFKKVQRKFGNVAEVVGAGHSNIDLKKMLSYLYLRGCRRVLLEGGQTIGSEFLLAGLVDELQVSVAPFFVGQKDAAKFLLPGKYLHNFKNRMVLKDVKKVGDMAVITWRLKKLV